MTASDTRRRTDVTAPLARFAVAGLLAVVVVGVVGLALLRHTARNNAIDEAKTVARLAGNGIVEPYVTPALLNGDEAARARLDRVVRKKVMEDNGIVRVKMWTTDGTVVYSDRHSLIGRRFPVSEDERHALKTGKAAAELTNLARAENRFERSEDKLLEVYLPIKATTGKPLLFEIYQRGSTIATSAKKTWVPFLPALVAALLLLQLLQLPLAHRMARRLQQGRLEREALLLRAIAASETERRRIAGDLHDGV